ncbi:hypothetical protein [Natrinema sp. 1APR25-10V2]|uniref:hypothetical protein n=1 Tax=Natrinema sp. 1APR25-10V2 TaxID=2951081 RepID=UPI0028760D27|nr:hypothetical protein [Natrinema sp. 1APR25-10V2]MDS0473959.1 hypothetical protein [Natrinema sp. 1APR25-10V2]
MAMDDLLEGTSLTGRQAAIIFFTFLALIILAGLLLITFSDFFRNLVMFVEPAGARVGSSTLVAGAGL